MPIYNFFHKYLYVPNKLAPMDNWERFYGNNLLSRKEHLRSYIYDHLKIPIKMKWYDGIKLMIYPNNDLGRALFTSGTYEPNSLLIVQNLLGKGSVFFDVGANVGVFTLAVSKLIGNKGLIIAFEPSTREHRLFEENLSLNRFSNVRLEKLAITNTNGSAQLNLAIDRHGGQNTLCQKFVHEGVQSGASEIVFTRTLDQYISEREISRLDLIKLDIEGSEYHALLGAKKTLSTLRPALLFEVFKSSLQKNQIDIMDMESALNSLGYVTFGIDDQTAKLSRQGLHETKDGNVVALHAEKLHLYKHLIASI
jgi:FkbM family methyltransferase